MDYWDHEAAALLEYENHWTNCMHRAMDQEMFHESSSDLVVDKDMIREDGQIKVLDDGNIKIKFEFPCQWVDCKWHLYYCKIARDVLWENYTIVYGAGKQ